jgi:hypothetical protein
LDHENGSIRPDERLIPGLCPIAVLIYRPETSEAQCMWAIALHHRHGDTIDAKPFGITYQPFN